MKEEEKKEWGKDHGKKMVMRCTEKFLATNSIHTCAQAMYS